MPDTTQVVSIPNVGDVEFPSTMSDADIATAARRLTVEAGRKKLADDRTAQQGKASTLPQAGAAAGAAFGGPIGSFIGERLGSTLANPREAALSAFRALGFPETQSGVKNITGAAKNVATGAATLAAAGIPGVTPFVARGVAAQVKQVAGQLVSEDPEQQAQGVGVLASLAVPFAAKGIARAGNLLAARTGEVAAAGATKLITKFGILPDEAFQFAKNPGRAVVSVLKGKLATALSEPLDPKLFPDIASNGPTVYNAFANKVAKSVNAVEGIRSGVLDLAKRLNTTIDARAAVGTLQTSISKLVNTFPDATAPYIKKLTRVMDDLNTHPLAALSIQKADELLTTLKDAARYETGVPAEFASKLREVRHTIAAAVDKQIPGYLKATKFEAELIDYLNGMKSRLVDDLQGKFFDPSRMYKGKYDAAAQGATAVVKPLGPAFHLPAIKYFTQAWNSTASTTARAALLARFADLMEQGTKSRSWLGKTPPPMVPGAAAPQAAPNPPAAPTGGGAAPRTLLPQTVPTPAAAPAPPAAVHARAAQAAVGAFEKAVKDEWTSFDEKLAREAKAPLPSAAASAQQKVLPEAPKPTAAAPAAVPTTAAAAAPAKAKLTRAQVHAGNDLGRTGVIVSEDDKTVVLRTTKGDLTVDKNDVTRLAKGDKAKDALRKEGERLRAAGVKNPDAPQAAAVGSGEDTGSGVEKVAAKQLSSEDYQIGIDAAMEALDEGALGAKGKTVASLLRDLAKSKKWSAQEYYEHTLEAIEKLQAGAGGKK